jgi:hypothetical protein
MKRSLFVVIVIITFRFSLFAEEGMWIPILLEQLNIKQMQEMGLKMTAGDIYSVNHSSMKDAIVQFGGGCTAEIVSLDGLILTNHHCGLGTIQRHSTVEHDYLTNGFWAKSRDEELPNPGLTVTLLVRMEDVTDKILQGVDEKMNQFQRSQVIKQHIETLEKEAVKGTHYEAKIRPFYYGNQFYLFVNEVFRDVRLVGAPPSAIGQFGGDTDNWIWPRHGGDFSVFRIYANKENQPAEYSKENVPYKPKNYLPISLKGYQQGDFTFVFGYPGSTHEYLTSYGVDLIANKENSVRIGLRQNRLDIMNEAMNRNHKIRIQYTSKHQGIANGWKKMIGETKGIKKLNAVAKKQEFEKEFQLWADSISSNVIASDVIARSEVTKQEATKQQESLPRTGNREPKIGNRYINLLSEFEKIYTKYLPVDMASVYLTEAGMGIEIVRFAGNFRELVKISKNKETKDENISQVLDNLKKTAKLFFKDYQAGIDKKVMKEMLAEMKKNMNIGYLPEVFMNIGKKYKSDFYAYTNVLFKRSLLTDSIRLNDFLKDYRKKDYKKLEKDPAYQLAVSIYSRNELNLAPLISKFNVKIDSLQRIYMAGQMEMQKKKRFYPDANSTIRISYGKVDDFNPTDGVHYNYYTTSQGILEKEDSTIYDYAVDPKLKDLFLTKDFGRYSDKDGTLHLAFTASNHTTGGNSGSPVLDANGYLIGLNFDRNWEGTMSDLMYDPDQCRNITLDIRYCLFIIDKYAGAGNLIKEMKIIE